MKKIIAIVVTLSTLLAVVPLTATAQTNKIVGHVYTSDIVAYIDDMPIKSYNIGGQTVVSENELARYGFQVTWNGNARQLYIDNGEKPQTAPSYTPDKRAPGKVIGDVYESDIKVYVNDHNMFLIPAYNIGGQTMIPLEELNKEITDCYSYNYNREIGYSNCGFKVTWNGEKRTIKADVLRKGSYVVTQYGRFMVSATSLLYRLNSWSIEPIDTVYKDTGFKDISQFLGELGIQYSFKDSVLTINQEINKTAPVSSGGNGVNRPNAIIPIVEVPVNINGALDKFHMILFHGELNTMANEWSPYLFE